MLSMENEILIDKFDAIREQLDVAIELYFTSDCIVATHTLVAAAYNLLRDISKQEGSEHPYLKTSFLDTLNEAARKKVINWLNEPENYFKHADRDLNKKLLFNPELTEIMLMDACAYFKDSDKERPKNYNVFKGWVGKIKEAVPKDSIQYEFLEILRIAFKAGGKKKFWEMSNRS